MQPITSLLRGLGLTLLVAGAPAIAAAEEAPPELAARAARLDALVAPYVAAGDFQGVIAIGRDGEPPLVRSYGRASLELGVPHGPGGVFMIGSVSKQFTAAAILLLEEDGALATDDPVAKHLPDFAHGERITIEQLLTHTSGVADVYSLPRFGATAGQSGTLAEVVADLGRMPLTHEPGSAHVYSNGGYSVLAAIVERASGDGYGSFLARRIFAPLGMTHTAHDAPGPAVPGRVPGYDPWGAHGLMPVAAVAPAYTAGSGSIWSSADDLLKWSAAIHRRRAPAEAPSDGSTTGAGGLLSDASYDKLVRDRVRGYGYGVSIFRRFGRDVIGHDGRVAGYASDLARYLEDEVTIVVLSNVQSVARDQIRRLAAAVAFDEEIEPPAPRVFAATPGVDLGELAGVYSFGPTLDVTVSAVGGRLLARANEGGTSELVPLAGGGWFSRMLYTGVRFGRDEAEQVDRLLWGLGDGAPAGRRAE